MNYSQYLQDGGTIKAQLRQLVEGAINLDPEATKQIESIMQAAQSGDSQAQQIASMIEEIMQELQGDSEGVPSNKCGGKVTKKVRKHACGSKAKKAQKGAELEALVIELKCGGKAKKTKKAETGLTIKKANTGCKCMLKRVGGKIVEVGCNGMPIAKQGMKLIPKGQEAIPGGIQFAGWNSGLTNLSPMYGARVRNGQLLLGGLAAVGAGGQDSDWRDASYFADRNANKLTRADAEKMGLYYDEKSRRWYDYDADAGKIYQSDRGFFDWSSDVPLSGKWIEIDANKMPLINKGVAEHFKLINTPKIVPGAQVNAADILTARERLGQTVTPLLSNEDAALLKTNIKGTVANYLPKTVVKQDEVTVGDVASQAGAGNGENAGASSTGKVNINWNDPRYNIIKRPVFVAERLVNTKLPQNSSPLDLFNEFIAKYKASPAAPQGRYSNYGMSYTNNAEGNPVEDWSNTTVSNKQIRNSAISDNWKNYRANRATIMNSGMSAHDKMAAMADQRNKRISANNEARQWSKNQQSAYNQQLAANVQSQLVGYNKQGGKLNYLNY